MNDESAARVRQIIGANRYLTLATTDGRTPWAAPVAYVADRAYTLYWTSRRDARHSRHLEQNPTAAVAIFDSRAGYGDVDGVQAEGHAEVVPDDEVPDAWDLYLARYPMYRELPVEVVMSSSPIGIYRFIPSAVYKLDTASTDGDRRLSVALPELRKFPIS